MDGETEVQLKERQSAEGPTQVDLWREYRSYQRMEVENAKQWVEFSQRQVKHFQQKEDNCVLQGWASTAERHHFEAEDARANVEEAGKQVKSHLCLEQSGGPMISRGSCTDQNWQSQEYSQYCADGKLKVSSLSQKVILP